MSRTGVSDGRIAELETERDFLLRSLEDLDEEHRAGEVDEDDYERLKDKYTARAAEVIRALSAETSNAAREAAKREGSERTRTHPAAARPKQKTKKGLLVGGILCVLAGIALALVASNTGTRLPGDTETGSVNLAPQEQVARELEQAAVYEQAGNYAAALPLFDEVISQQPDNVDALASAGWLEFEAGVLKADTKSLEQGETDETHAVSLDAKEAIPHAYLGSMYFLEGQTEAAVIQYAQFIADKPTGADVAPFLRDMEKAYQEAKAPLPKLPSGS